MNSDSKPSKVLIVSFQYWPALDARAFRWTALAEDWVRKGYQVHVVCSRLSTRPDLEIVEGVQLHRVGSWLEDRRATPGETPRSHPLLRVVGKVVRAAWREVYWPDTSCTWYFDARRKTRDLIRTLNPGAIVCVSPAFTSVAAGYSLARDPSRAYSWIIDLGDPFSFAEEAPPNNFRLYRELNTRFERSCFAAADAVSVTNPATGGRYSALFPESAGKIEIIPPLISLPPAGGDDSDNPPGTRKLVFLGKLYSSIRRPDFLLALFAELARSRRGEYELHFFGDSRECAKNFEPYRELIGRSIFLHGPVPRARAAEEMRSALALVNIGNTTEYQLPSKIAEYAACGKPILNIAATPDDSSSRFLVGYPAHLTLTAKAADPTAEDLKRFEEFLAGAPRRIPERELRDWLAPFTLAEVSSRYLSLLSRRRTPGTGSR